MNKNIIMLFMVIFSAAGSFLPILVDGGDIFSLWGILGGFVGGIFGIWVGVVVAKKFA